MAIIFLHYIFFLFLRMEMVVGLGFSLTTTSSWNLCIRDFGSQIGEEQGIYKRSGLIWSVITVLLCLFFLH